MKTDKEWAVYWKLEGQTTVVAKTKKEARELILEKSTERLTWDCWRPVKIKEIRQA